MINKIIGTAGCILLALIYPSFLAAQNQNLSTEKIKKPLFDKLNFSFGGGSRQFRVAAPQ